MTLVIYLQIIAFVFGVAFGAGVAVWIVLRWWPRVTAIQVTVTPEAIARAIAAGGGIHCTTPPVLVDWNIIHSVVEANGYRLIAKHEDQAGAPKRH